MEASRHFVGALLVGASVGVACLIPNVDLSSRLCADDGSCVAGYVCEKATNRCVVPVPGDDAGTPFVITDVHPIWVGSRNVRVDWQMTGEMTNFKEYNAFIGSTAESVRDETTLANKFDPRIDPDLSQPGVGDAGPLASSIVFDRVYAANDYFVKVRATDLQGRSYAGDIFGPIHMKADETKTLSLYAGALAETAFAVPTGATRVAKPCAFAATVACLEYPPVACARADGCSFDVGVQGFTNKVAPMTNAEFADAYVEIAVRGKRAAAIGNVDIVLTIGDASCSMGSNPCRFRTYENDSFPLRPSDTEFRIAQAPLARLRLETPSGPGQSLDAATFGGAGWKVYGITAHAAWTNNSVLGVNHALLRY